MKYIQRRILTYIVVFIAVINLVFILPRLVPGNAAQILAAGSKVPAQAIKLLEIRFGLNQPVYVQYELYLKGIFGTWPPDFGISFGYYPDTVTHLFMVRVPWTLLLILSSLALSLFMAYVVAAVSSLRRGGKFEATAMYVSILLNSTPIFWSAMVLLWVFAVSVNWFPQFGSVDEHLNFGPAYIESVLVHAILPIIALSLSIFGESYLLLRGSSQEVLRSDYVLTAKSRGLADRILASAYILRNSLLPLVSIITFSLASLISRVVLVEAIFSYPGIGDLIVDAVRLHDYPVIEGSLFYLTVMVIIGGLLGDFLLLRLDPRLRA